MACAKLQSCARYRLLPPKKNTYIGWGNGTRESTAGEERDGYAHFWSLREQEIGLNQKLQNGHNFFPTCSRRTGVDEQTQLWATSDADTGVNSPLYL